jgi:hypothetical protein
MPDPILRPSDAENLAGVETGRQHLSHSRIGVFLACHRKYELQYEERLEPVSRPAALSMGSAFQKAIELQDPNAAALVLDGYTYEPNEGAAGGWIYTPPAESPYFHTQEAEDKHRVNQAIVRAAAALYLRRWPSPVGEAREFEYRVRLRNPWTGHYSLTFDLQGFADGLIGPPDLHFEGNWYRAGREAMEQAAPYELVENKLVGRIDQITVQRLPLDRQLQLGRYGVWRATGRPVNRPSCGLGLSSFGRCGVSASTTGTQPPAPILGAASTSRSVRAIRMRSISTTAGRRRKWSSIGFARTATASTRPPSRATRRRAVSAPMRARTGC